MTKIKRLVLALSLPSLCFALVAEADPVASGSSITFNDDDWYQVQRPSDYSTVCEGVRSCEVEPGTYIVINHTTGSRWNRFLVTAIDDTNQRPSAVSGLDGAVYSDTAAEIFWKSASAAGESISGYTVSIDGAAVKNTTGHSFYIDNLQAATTYQFGVTAIDDTGATSETSSINLTTTGEVQDFTQPEQVALPSDCLLDNSDDGKTFCYSDSTRTLLATNEDGTRYWGFDLPGDPALNQIRHLKVIGYTLLLVAELNPELVNSDYEISAFSLDGQFLFTAPILGNITTSTDDVPLTIAEDNGDLIIAGEFRYQSTASNTANLGSFLTRMDVSNGDRLGSRKFPDRRLDDLLNISGKLLLSSLDGAPIPMNKVATFNLAEYLVTPVDMQWSCETEYSYNTTKYETFEFAADGRIYGRAEDGNYDSPWIVSDNSSVTIYARQFSKSLDDFIYSPNSFTATTSNYGSGIIKCSLTKHSR